MPMDGATPRREVMVEAVELRETLSSRKLGRRMVEARGIELCILEEFDIRYL